HIAVRGTNVWSGNAEADVASAFKAKRIEKAVAAADDSLRVQRIGKAKTGLDVRPVGVVRISGVAIDAGERETAIDGGKRSRIDACRAKSGTVFHEVGLVRWVVRDRIDAGKAHAAVQAVVTIAKAALHVIADANIQGQVLGNFPVILQIDRAERKS